MTPFNYSRRTFVKTLSSGLAGAAGGFALSACSQPTSTKNNDRDNDEYPIGNDDEGMPNQQRPSYYNLLPRRPLGNTDMDVSMLSFGGGSQFMANEHGDWEPLLERALELGINYFDTSIDYEGSEARFSEILTPIRDQIYIASKFNGMKHERRNADVMKQELETTLKRLKTDYLDVYMVHAVDENDTLSDISKIYDEMKRLQDQRVIKQVGFSSMDSAAKSAELLKTFEFDVCMLAINPTKYGDYETVAVPEAIKKNTGVLAMKVMRNVVGKDGTTAEELLSWALDRDGVAGAVIAHLGRPTLEQNAEIVMKYKPSVVPHGWSYLETRLHRYAGPHALCWAHPNYKDEFLVA